MLTKTPRTVVEDAEITQNLSNVIREREIWRRVSAKNLRFERASFKYTIFENCYFRNCEFVDCNFTGAMFIDGNLRGSTFDGSTFDYCRFTRTILEHDILVKNMPGYENVQMELARNLRANYSQIGDTNGVNKAIRVELAATRVHLQKAAWSAETHYRNKIKGAARFRAAFDYAQFVLWDAVWGNGESPLRIVRLMLLVMGLIALGAIGRDWPVTLALVNSLPWFFGVTIDGPELPAIVLTIAVIFRLLLLAMFTSVLIKRLARR